jgi:hypothetical protein
MAPKEQMDIADQMLIPETETDSSTVHEYKKLDEKCNKVLEKIKTRKDQKSKKHNK